MPKLHALELVPDDAGRAAVRALWDALREAGLPSQADHTGASNQPHVTVVEAAALAGHAPGDADLVAANAELQSDTEALTRSLLGSGAAHHD